MSQQCPRCETKFRVDSLKDYNDGNLKMSNYPVAGKATFCPYCGVQLSRWAAWIGKVVFIIYPDDEEEIVVILKAIAEDNETFTVFSERNGRTFIVNEKYVFTA